MKVKREINIFGDLTIHYSTVFYAHSTKLQTTFLICLMPILYYFVTYFFHQDIVLIYSTKLLTTCVTCIVLADLLGSLYYYDSCLGQRIQEMGKNYCLCWSMSKPLSIIDRLHIQLLDILKMCIVHLRVNMRPKLLCLMTTFCIVMDFLIDGLIIVLVSVLLLI